jgi:hypothetical protein
MRSDDELEVGPDGAHLPTADTVLLEKDIHGQAAELNLSVAQDEVREAGHADPEAHLRPKDPAPFEAGRFPTFTADVARTGYYGFPLNRDGVVKIANHGLGTRIDAADKDSSSGPCSVR